MKNGSLPTLSLCNTICAAMMIILLILQFTPFWTVGEDAAAVSIGGYVWFPTDHSDLTSHIQQTVDPDFRINDIVIPTILMLLLSAAGTVLNILKRNDLWVCALPAVCGVAGLFGFLSQPALRMGSTWGIQLALCILMLTTAVVGLIMEIHEHKHA